MKKLDDAEWEDINARIERLREVAEHDYRHFEQLIGSILEPLLRHEGFGLEVTPPMHDGGIDFLGVRETPKVGGGIEKIGIETKLYRGGRKVGLEIVRGLVGAAVMRSLDRVAIVSNAQFSPSARAAVARNMPVNIELLGFDDLKAWAERLRADPVQAEAEVRIIMKEMSQGLARLIAAAPDALAYLEWRDVERVVAEVFEGLGFEAELTPGSKDGGKDVVLTCTVSGKKAQYYVEVKHWRSSTKVGASAVQKLLEVVVREKKDGGLFLSTYGYTENAFTQLTAVDRRKLRFGDKDKIVAFCQTYVKAQAGLWSPPENLSQILFEEDAA